MNTLISRMAAATALVATVALLTPADAASQLSLEGRLGATVPTGDLSDLEQTAGLAVAAELMYTVRPNLSLYGGVGHHRFTCDGCDTDFSSTGVVGGAKFVLSSTSDALPWVRGGLMLHRPEEDGDTGEWGVGLDAGAGIDWRVAPSFYLVPALRLNTYGSEGFTFTYLTIDLGAHFHLGG